MTSVTNMTPAAGTIPAANYSGSLSIESKNIFTILRKWLYTQPDIVFRELISNALDAISKRELLTEGRFCEGRILVSVDRDKGRILISDNGVGMTAREVDTYINNIAFSGARDFISRRQETQEEQIIGHFGVGFYSAFMYSEHVTLETLSCQEGSLPVRWDGRDDMSFSMSAGSKDRAGTTVILNLGDKEEGRAFLENPSLVRDAIKKYFPFAKTPIFFTAEGFQEALINQPSPLWKRSRSEIVKEEMDTFYKEYFGDSSTPLFFIKFESLDLGVRGILFFQKYKTGNGGAGRKDPYLFQRCVCRREPSFHDPQVYQAPERHPGM